MGVLNDPVCMANWFDILDHKSLLATLNVTPQKAFPYVHRTITMFVREDVLQYVLSHFPVVVSARQKSDLKKIAVNGRWTIRCLDTWGPRLDLSNHELLKAFSPLIGTGMTVNDGEVGTRHVRVWSNKYIFQNYLNEKGDQWQGVEFSVFNGHSISGTVTPVLAELWESPELSQSISSIRIP